MEEKQFSDISYNQFINEKRLMGSRCKECSDLFLPPRSICTKCHKSEMEWVEMKGRGKLKGFTSIAIGPPSMIAEGYNRKNPYCVGVVELEEGVKVVARIDEVDALKPESIKVGMPLVTKYLHFEGGEGSRTYLAFRPL